MNQLVTSQLQEKISGRQQTPKRSKIIWYSCYFLSPCLLQIASSGGHDDFYRFFTILGHRVSNLHNSAKSIFSISRSKVLGKKPLCITGSGNISLKLFMAPLETIELLTFWYVVAKHYFAQLQGVSNFWINCFFHSVVTFSIMHCRTHCSL